MNLECPLPATVGSPQNWAGAGALTDSRLVLPCGCWTEASATGEQDMEGNRLLSLLESHAEKFHFLPHRGLVYFQVTAHPSCRVS